MKGTELYKIDDAGIVVDIYNGLTEYTIPGPALIEGSISSVEQSQSAITATGTATVGSGGGGNAPAPPPAPTYPTTTAEQPAEPEPTTTQEQEQPQQPTTTAAPPTLKTSACPAPTTAAPTT